MQGASVCSTLTWWVMRKNQLVGLGEHLKHQLSVGPAIKNFEHLWSVRSPKEPVHLLATVFPHSGPGRKSEQSPGRGSPRTTWVSVPCFLLPPCVATLLAQDLMVSSCASLHLKAEVTNSKPGPLALQWELGNGLA